jgi:hypothetical protein
MMRPCTCGKLSIYNRDGRVVELDGGANCLTDNEVRTATILLKEEWERRFKGVGGGPVRLYA